MNFCIIQLTKSFFSFNRGVVDLTPEIVNSHAI